MTRVALAGLLALIALNAFGGGIYGMSGAPDVPTSWLAGSPFRSYFVPGLVLFVVVGGTFALAAVAVTARDGRARLVAAAAVAIGAIWLTTQIAVIGVVSWMQPVTAFAMAFVALLTLRWRPA